MINGALVLWIIAIVLAFWALRRNTARARLAMAAAAERYLEIMPRIGLALLAAGFLSVLIPSEPVARYIGPESGFPGILLASLVGGFVPGGPILSFPLVVVLYKAGAGIPQLIEVGAATRHDSIVYHCTPAPAQWVPDEAMPACGASRAGRAMQPGARLRCGQRG